MSQPNRWASPEGYKGPPPSVRYMIRKKVEQSTPSYSKTNGEEIKEYTPGELVERKTSKAYDSGMQAYYHSFAPEDQHLADCVTVLIQRACAYFYASDDEYEPLEGVADIRITDDEVRERIHRIERGENVREAMRTGKGHYVLSDLPFDQQRALIEQIEALKARWGFEILGEVDDRPKPAVEEAHDNWHYGI